MFTFPNRKGFELSKLQMHLLELQAHLDEPGEGLGPSVGIGDFEREEGADTGVDSHGLE